jgi:uncharacterized protein YjdB
MCEGKVINMVNNIILSPQHVGIKPGETAQVTYYTESIYNQTMTINHPLEWFCEKPEIAQVDANGLISGIKEGKTKIVVKSCDNIESANVVVSLTGSSYCYHIEDPFIRNLLHKAAFTWF